MLEIKTDLDQRPVKNASQPLNAGQHLNLPVIATKNLFLDQAIIPH
jgi:hypothetical protein